MKKQTKKLSLNKTTISNLQPSEMNNKNGGASGPTCACHGHRGGGSAGCSRNGNTCPGHNTCYTC